MLYHDVRVLGYKERGADDDSSLPDTTVAVLTVRPPITVGNRFDSVILGEDPYGVRVDEVGSTVVATVLRAEVGHYGADEGTRVDLINRIVSRVCRFAEDPTRSLVMMSENPFPRPPERR